MMARVILGVVVCGISGLLFLRWHNSESVNKCKTIQIGDTQEHVLKIMGPPTQIRPFNYRGESGNTLYFPSPFAAATIAQVYIDSESLTVESIHWEEGHRVLKNPKREEN